MVNATQETLSEIGRAITYNIATGGIAMKRLSMLAGGLLLLVGSTVPAHATINIKVAEVQSTSAYVQGSKAAPNADIFWEGTKVTSANKGGNFSFYGVIPSDCVGTLSDGTPVEVALLNCTPVAVAPAPVPQTGQTLYYNFDGTPEPINCADTGQDGELRKGVAWPTPRFNDNGNGTITDNLTGLIWLQNAGCFGTVTWIQALAAANSLANSNCNLSDGSVAGDWRLPNVRELRSLIDYAQSNPALPSGHPFTNVQPGIGNYPYWTSTTIAGNPYEAWCVSFGVGGLLGSTKDSLHYIMAVRGGQ